MISGFTVTIFLFKMQLSLHINLKLNHHHESAIITRPNKKPSEKKKYLYSFMPVFYYVAETYIVTGE